MISSCSPTTLPRTGGGVNLFDPTPHRDDHREVSRTEGGITATATLVSGNDNYFLVVGLLLADGRTLPGEPAFDLSGGDEFDLGTLSVRVDLQPITPPPASAGITYAELLALAAKHYEPGWLDGFLTPDGRLNYAAQPPNSGTLERHIAIELFETFDPDASRQDALAEARRALQSTLTDIERALRGLDETP